MDETVLVVQEGEHKIKRGGGWILVGNTPIRWVAMETQDSDTVGDKSETLEEEKNLRMERRKGLMFNCQMFIITRMRTMMFFFN